MTATDFAFARRNMVEYQIRCCKVLDPVVLDLIESMPRENFLPEHVKSLAYMEGKVPLPCNQEMLSPLQEALILQNLMLDGSESVLEIGTGTGFLTTMLAMQSADVVSCEIHADLANSASENISNHGVSNAKVIQVNAMDAEAMAQIEDLNKSFDVIVLSAATKEVPAHIEKLLRDGGQMIAFIGSNPVVSMVLRRKIGQIWQETSLFETLLQDMEGIAEKREFVF
ncbi:protein-L-isoaspartate(D-aspartate) O-methyltransferase [Mariprofundus micogutta]|uniref:Protein-L-isoaspartate O-methyltransferase n=1 Tax=Mariprofundus micogutta TaxID=1921010 RepID=A0A1L8CLP1_9PROT|nr:methyltransferase domain-containing protein [Mariprofundus micogutta]GAV19822.1 protein-L-isoaspartate(D-aspartate) O-methyltransferase [Mariprofundus micogutta]